MNDLQHTQEYFASCPKQLEALLRTEIEEIGGPDIRESLRETVAGVYFTTNKSTLYKICLWTRLANRILMPLTRGKIESEQDLYRIAGDVKWEEIFCEGASIVVDFIGSNDVIRHTQFGAQRIKDAVVDRYLAKTEYRPSVDKNNPDVRINARLHKSEIILSLDVSGESLHRRGYRSRRGAAPLKENLAAAILLRAGVKEFAKSAKEKQQPLVIVDPLCGSGTFLVEAALIARNIAPGKFRDQFGFEKLLDFDAALWQSVKEEGASLEDNDIKCDFYGYDDDENVISFAKSNAVDAGVDADIQCNVRNLQSFKPEFPENTTSGLMICNPPYGERLGEVEALRSEYKRIGQIAKDYFEGFTCGVLTSNKELGSELRLRSKNRYKFFNGPIAAELLLFDIKGKDELTLRRDISLKDKPLSEGGTMVANRLKKNQRRLQSWINKNNISAYRLYDADMPEYAAAIDIYDGYAHIQEYQAPKNVDENKAKRRFDEIKHAVVVGLGIPEEKVFTKVRKKQKGNMQYEKYSNDKVEPQHTLICSEGKAKFWVNLKDYLDTGLFLDHRPLRHVIGQNVEDKSFLNLFCYTATASVHAALAGASRSVSVDMSNTYLNWAQENFSLNNISPQRHKLVRDDCIEWLRNCREGFDVIMLDPPTFSNSKRTETVLDIQRDHVSLVSRCMDILKPGGVLYFSNNHRGFKLDEEALARFEIEDITQQSIDPDFERNQKIHVCYKITAKTA